MNKERLSNLAGWAGIVLIQGATVPVMVNNILGNSETLPPLSMTFLIWSGLLLFLGRGIERKDFVAIVSNSLGFALQSVMLGLIVFPRY